MSITNKIKKLVIASFLVTVLCFQTQADDPQFSGSLGFDYNSHFISSGKDVWGTGGDPDGLFNRQEEGFKSILLPFMCRYSHALPATGRTHQHIILPKCSIFNWPTYFGKFCLHKMSNFHKAGPTGICRN